MHEMFIPSQHSHSSGGVAIEKIQDGSERDGDGCKRWNVNTIEHHDSSGEEDQLKIYHRINNNKMSRIRNKTSYSRNYTLEQFKIAMKV